jgi:FdhD protein
LKGSTDRKPFPCRLQKDAMQNPDRQNLFDDLPIIPWKIQRIRSGGDEFLDEHLVLEEPLEIVINGKSVAVLMRMPGREKELAAGFCLTEGYVKEVRDILLIHHCGLGLPAPDEEEGEEGGLSRNRIELSVAPEAFRGHDASDSVRLIRSGCGAADVSVMSDALPFLSQDIAVDPSVVLKLSREMRTMQEVHPKSGGTHSAAVFDVEGNAIHLAEDIGRHNAVDKALGYCLLRKIPLNDKILVTSGRASYEMVTKAVRAGLGVIATLSAPTSLAAQIAQDRGLTLIGYLRGSRMNVYTHAGRLRSEQSRDRRSNPLPLEEK